MQQKLHNYEYHRFNDMSREVKKLIKEYLLTNEFYQRLTNYIKLANDNLDKFHKTICNRNSYYCNCELKEVSFNKESLLTSGYEICIWYKNKDGGHTQLIDISSFIIFLAESNLIEDSEIKD